MPIVHIRALSPLDGAPAPLASIAEAVAAACDCPPEEVWCTFSPLAAVTIGARPVEQASGIVFVELVMRSRGVEPDAAALEAAARATASSFRIPLEDAWARLSLVEPGTVFAGGSPLER